jgi:FtsP/CotA-like multicopper oxidase with cupredoxin domain
MDRTRRSFLRGAALLGAGVITTRGMAETQAQSGQSKMQMPPGMKMDHGKMQMNEPAQRTSAAETGSLSVITPDLPCLPFQMDNGVKVFHLVAEPVKRAFLPGYTFDLWGYNGTAPGPTIEVNQGDRVRIIVENHLPEATSMHWHGFEIPIGMDGVPGVCQSPIPPGGRYVYEFTLHQEGTFFYHSHMAMQEMMGMIGLFIMHPKTAYSPKVDRDFGLILQEFAILPNNTVPNTMSMEFNWLTLNGRSGPATTPLLVKLGERVRIRMVNMGMDHHPMHLHGNTFFVTGTEAGRAPESTWRPENTVLVGVAQARDIEFDAIYPGDWMLHCHLPHHMMNHMASMVGPLTEPGHGMPAGMGMKEGMGMLQQGSATGRQNGPSLGRSMGVGSDYENATTNMPLSQMRATHDTAHHKQEMNAHQMEQMNHPMSTNPQAVLGFPQDMFMPMDAAVAKPETYGLRPTWSGGVGGMSTLVRVLEPALYEKIMELKQQARSRSRHSDMSMPVPHRLHE